MQISLPTGMGQTLLTDRRGGHQPRIAAPIPAASAYKKVCVRSVVGLKHWRTDS